MAEDDVSLDLTEGAAAPRQAWGRPGLCPTCGSAGYLEHIDLIDRVMYQKCTNWECRTKWETTEAQLASQT